MDKREESTDTIFHERISILKEKGYRGFKINSIRKEWDGVMVTAGNNAGRMVTASGETNEEAYEKLIEKIDQVLEFT